MVKAIVNVLIGFASQRATNFAFLDQVVVSGANFVAGILLARSWASTNTVASCSPGCSLNLWGRCSSPLSFSR